MDAYDTSRRGAVFRFFSLCCAPCAVRGADFWRPGQLEILCSDRNHAVVGSSASRAPVSYRAARVAVHEAPANSRAASTSTRGRHRTAPHVPRTREHARWLTASLPRPPRDLAEATIPPALRLLPPAASPPLRLLAAAAAAAAATAPPLPTEAPEREREACVTISLEAPASEAIRAATLT